MAMQRLFLLSGVFACSFAFRFTYHDCNHSPNKVLRITNGHINPDPVHIPGKESGSLDLEILRNISGNHFRLDVIVEKHVLFGYPDIPCISNVGSCSYDLCHLLSKFEGPNGTSNCPQQLAQSNFPCHCPFKPGHYHLEQATFKIPELSGVWQFLASGDYKLHAKLIDTRTGEQVGCYDVQLTTEADCSGIFCIIG